jgi:hypothetical protein
MTYNKEWYFKEGVADGLLHGTQNEDIHSKTYKDGYDYGIWLYCEMNNLDKE